MTNSLFEDLREEAAERKIPILAHFDLTYDCNLRCGHCYVVKENRPELTTAEIKSILAQLAETGVLYLTLSGGEILTRKDFFEIAFYARELNFALRLLTNGTLLNEEKVKKVSSFYPELVGISIYSTKPEVHDKITTQKGSFKKSISAIKMLRDQDVRVKISTIIMRQNINDYHLIYELAQKFGTEFQADYRIAPKSNGARDPLDFHIKEKDLFRVLSDPIFLREDQTELQETSLTEHYSGVFDTIPCGAGHMSCYISPYGDVCPCVQLLIKCGNLKENSFNEIWEKSPQMQKFRAVTISDLPVCSSCNLFQYCRLCLGLNYTEEKNIFSPSKRTCKEAKIMKKIGKRRR